MKGILARVHAPAARAVAGAILPAAFGICAATTAVAAQHQGQSPYAGSSSEAVKTMTTDEVSALLAAEGMGLARPAELNGYPGPRHVLDLADSLGLNQRQRDRTRVVFDGMQARAKALGQEIIEAESDLDRGFAAGAQAAELERLVSGAARLHGELRWVHLQAHLEMARLLSAHQRQEYDRLRGYGGHTH